MSRQSISKLSTGVWDRTLIPIFVDKKILKIINRCEPPLIYLIPKFHAWGLSEDVRPNPLFKFTKLGYKWRCAKHELWHWRRSTSDNYEDEDYE